MSPEQAQLEAAIAALQSQRGTLGDAVVELATPLRAQLAGRLAPAGLPRRQVTVPFANVVGSNDFAVRAQPDGALRPWGLLRSLLAAQFGVADNDSADVARSKVVEGLSPWFNESGERQAHS